MNRLEQFKKRQREDAARVQQELGGVFAGGAPQGLFGGDLGVEGGNDADDELEEDDFVEDYEPEMSPAPVDLRALHLEERKLPIVTEDDYLRELVSCIASMFRKADAPVCVETQHHLGYIRAQAAHLQE